MSTYLWWEGYNPINQIVGYVLSGDPAYVPCYNNARNQIRKYERDEIVEELVRYYLKGQGSISNENYGTRRWSEDRRSSHQWSIRVLLLIVWRLPCD